MLYWCFLGKRHDMTAPWQEYLTMSAALYLSINAFSALFLIHNEAHLLPDLLRALRAMGDIAVRRSGRPFKPTKPRYSLRCEPDVTVFCAPRGSTYAKDKRAWRGTLLDGLSEGRLVPEH